VYIGGTNVGPVFKGQFLDSVTPVDGTEMLSQNISDQLRNSVNNTGCPTLHLLINMNF
jgi:hypothetical protein